MTTENSDLIPVPPLDPTSSKWKNSAYPQTCALLERAGIDPTVVIAAHGVTSRGYREYVQYDRSPDALSLEEQRKLWEEDPDITWVPDSPAYRTKTWPDTMTLTDVRRLLDCYSIENHRMQEMNRRHRTPLVTHEELKYPSIELEPTNEIKKVTK